MTFGRSTPAYVYEAKVDRANGTSLGSGKATVGSYADAQKLLLALNGRSIGKLLFVQPCAPPERRMRRRDLRVVSAHWHGRALRDAWAPQATRLSRWSTRSRWWSCLSRSPRGGRWRSSTPTSSRRSASTGTSARPGLTARTRGPLSTGCSWRAAGRTCSRGPSSSARTATRSRRRPPRRSSCWQKCARITSRSPRRPATSSCTPGSARGASSAPRRW